MTIALRIYQTAYGKGPSEYWNDGSKKTDIVFDELDDQSLYDSAISIVALDELRFQRDQLLSATDWRATVDYPGTDQEEWLTYRQALRDLPSTTQTPSLDENGNLINVTWPEEPV